MEDRGEDWVERCEVHGLDLRDVVGLSEFIENIQRRYRRLVRVPVFWECRLKICKTLRMLLVIRNL